VLENKKLTYYKTIEMTKVKGFLNFDTATVELKRKDEKYFNLTIKGADRVFELFAEENGEKWQELLNKHIKHSRGYRETLDTNGAGKFWKFDSISED